MPDKDTLRRARQDAEEGKSPSTQAGEFIREEIEHVREGKHGARSAKQAIAIGLSKARRAGVKPPPPDPSKTSQQTVPQSQGRLRRGEQATPAGEEKIASNHGGAQAREIHLRILRGSFEAGPNGRFTPHQTRPLGGRQESQRDA